MSDCEKAEIIILAVLNQIGCNLSNETVRIVGELVAHNEAGVALETLCSQVLEYGI